MAAALTVAAVALGYLLGRARLGHRACQAACTPFSRPEGDVRIGQDAI